MRVLNGGLGGNDKYPENHITPLVTEPITLLEVKDEKLTVGADTITDEESLNIHNSVAVIKYKVGVNDVVPRWNSFESAIIFSPAVSENNCHAIPLKNAKPDAVAAKSVS
jgi:hypothetical protein